MEENKKTLFYLRLLLLNFDLNFQKCSNISIENVFEKKAKLTVENEFKEKKYENFVNQLQQQPKTYYLALMQSTAINL